MDKLYQIRYYGIDNPKNYPIDIQGSDLQSDVAPFLNTEGLTRVEVQGLPGTSFNLSINGETVPGAIILGQVGIYHLDLKSNERITSLSFSSNTINVINNAPAKTGAFLVVTVTY